MGQQRLEKPLELHVGASADRDNELNARFWNDQRSSLKGPSSSLSPRWYWLFYSALDPIGCSQSCEMAGRAETATLLDQHQKYVHLQTYTIVAIYQILHRSPFSKSVKCFVMWHHCHQPYRNQMCRELSMMLAKPTKFVFKPCF